MFGKEKAIGAEQAAARKYKIDKETANNEFIRYCENNDIDFDESKMNEEENE
jgi:hypothetical protein